jgi:arylsulfatase
MRDESRKSHRPGTVYRRIKAFLGLLLLFGVSSLAAAAPPNIVIIFMDDMGYGDIDAYGATKQKTPNLDRMAAEGMKLTSFYAAPVCSVSRAQLLTGSTACASMCRAFTAPAEPMA